MKHITALEDIVALLTSGATSCEYTGEALLTEILSIASSALDHCVDESEQEDEPWDGFNSDVEADADALASCGWGTDEDYGCYGDDY